MSRTVEMMLKNQGDGGEESNTTPTNSKFFFWPEGGKKIP